MLFRNVILTSFSVNLLTGPVILSLCKTRAPCAHATVELLRQEAPDFLALNLQPPNSRDLSPVDFEIWAVMQCCVCQRQIGSVDELNWRLIDVWCGL